MNVFDSMSAAIQNAQKNISAQIQALFLTPRSGQLYRLVCANSGKVLDVDGGSVQDGAAVQQWTVTGGANQHWSFEAVGPVNGQPAYKLVCANSGKVLTCAGSGKVLELPRSQQVGTAVTQWPYQGGANQQWYVLDAGNNTCKIRSVGLGTVLDVEGGSVQDGARVIHWNDNDGANQHWSLVPVLLSIVSGNNQTQPRVQTASGRPIATFTPLSVAFKDTSGNPLVGKQITWTVHNPAGMEVTIGVTSVGGVPVASASATSTTDANGIATSNSAEAVDADGAFTIGVSSDSGASVTFNEAVGGTPSSVLSTTIVAGNNQSVARTGTGAPDGSGIASFAPLQVKVLNPNGTPAKGVEVGFSIFDSNGLPLMPFGMECQLQPDGSPFSVAITDSNGIATLNQFSSGNSIFCYYNSGPFTVLAYTAGGSTTPVIFHETVSS